MPTLQGLLRILGSGYPDRLGFIAAGPVNLAVRGLFRLLKPFMPRRLPSKIKLMGNPPKNLAELVPPDTIPTFFGGPANHDNVVRGASDGTFSWTKVCCYTCPSPPSPLCVVLCLPSFLGQR